MIVWHDHKFLFPVVHVDAQFTAVATNSGSLDRLITPFQ